MAEIVDPWILDPEGFSFTFAKTEGFQKRNCKILQFINTNISFHSHFSTYFTDFEKKLSRFQINLPLGIETVNYSPSFISPYTIKNRGISESWFLVPEGLKYSAIGDIFEKKLKKKT